jgi:beta-lactam-binding protein with PASTA domain
MSIKKFLVSRTFIVNLFIAIALVAIIIFIVLKSLNAYTHHGESNPVPDFTGMLEPEVKTTAEQNHLRINIIDSVYTDAVQPGGVVDQVPKAGFGVKENRTIFLTINYTQKERVALPKLTDISFRQAQVLTKNCGLLVGEISYRPSEYNNLVLKILQDSMEVLPGNLLLKGSKIDFIVGRDSENEQTPLPDLINLGIEPAKEIITNAMLNLGALIYDESVTTAEDSLNAIIWKQYPNPKTTSSVEMGTSVDLWVTVDEEKINPVLEQENSDK